MVDIAKPQDMPRPPWTDAPDPVSVIGGVPEIRAELEAMGNVYLALFPLAPDVRERVLRTVRDKLGMNQAVKTAGYR